MSVQKRRFLIHAIVTELRLNSYTSSSSSPELYIDVDIISFYGLWRDMMLIR